ncbi:hypothetical protein OK016_26155 [Vibrio chagasii]|nr:hypothetical protein [Vibrio chagasii]
MVKAALTDLEAMGLSATGTDWNSPCRYDGISDTYGAYYVLKVDPGMLPMHELYLAQQVSLW